MNIRVLMYLILFFLCFFDFLFINIPVGPVHMTLLRVVLLGGMYILLIEQLVYKKHFYFQSVGYPLLFFFVWFCYGTIQTLWAVDKVGSIKELYYLALFIFLIVLIIRVMSSNFETKWISRSFSGIGVIMILVCIFEIMTERHLGTSRYVIEASRFSGTDYKAATGVFYNENDLSFFLVLVAPFFMVRMFSKKYGIAVLNGVCLLAIVAIIFINDAKLAFLALIFQGAAYLLISKKVKLKYALVSFGSFLLLLINLLMFTNVGSAFKNILLTLYSGSNLHRINLYLNGVYSVMESWFLGVGPGNFKMHIHPQFDTGGNINPHNWWIELLTDFGFIIFCLYILFFIFMVRKLWCIYTLNIKYSPLAFALLLSLVGFILGSIGPSSLFYFWPVWLLYGVILGLINFVENQYPQQLIKKSIYK